MNILNAIMQFFLTPTNIADPERKEDTKTTHSVSVVMLVLGLISIPFVFLLTSPIREYVLAGNGVVICIWLYTIYLVKRGHHNTAKIIILVVNTVNLISITYVTGGLTTATIFISLFLLAMANLLFPIRGAIIYGLILFGLVLIIYVLNQVNMVPASTVAISTNSIFWTFTFTLIAISSILAIASANYQSNLQSIRKNENELRERNFELDSLKNSLEMQISERTNALEERARQLQAVSTVAQSIASIQDLDKLLPGITTLLSRQFGFYHVGIFLLDKQGEYAVLRAANSEGGIHMLARNHKLLLDSNSIVGYSASHGEARIALDVGADAIYFNNPDLPDTRSEMALPLRAGGRVIGVLDVQSKDSNAFTKEDLDTLSTLANQVTIAIENARLLKETGDALAEAQKTFERYIKQDWQNFAQLAKHKGYVFDGKQVTPLDNETWQEKTRVVPQTGSLSLKRTSSTLAVPIKLRGQTIGILDVRTKQGQREWSKDEITLLEAAAERAALALENARLVENAQRRAARERTIGDISTKIGAVSNMDSILQTAVEELGRRIGGITDVSIEIDTTDNQVA